MKINIKSYKFKITSVVIIAFFVIFVVTSIITVNDIKNTAVSILSDYSTSLLNQARELIDIPSLKRLIQTDNSNDEYYIQTIEKMNELRLHSNALYLYVMAPVRGTIYKYVLDGNYPDDEMFSPIGSEEDIESYGKWPFRCMEEQQIILGDFSQQDQWGWASTVYYPIVDENGKSIAFLGCDYDVSKIMTQMYQRVTIMFIISAIAIIVSIIILLFVIGALFRRINAVTKSMEDISTGTSDLTTKLDAQSGTEIDDLAQAFNKVTSYLQRVISDIKTAMKILSKNNEEMTKQNQNILENVNTMKDVNNIINSKAKTQSSLTSEAHENIKIMMDNASLLDSNVENQSIAMIKSTKAVEEISSIINTSHNLFEEISVEYDDIVNKSVNEQKKQQQLTEEIKRMVEQAHSLNQANNMISDIAERTNLLAMNAAIEASHAGQYGVGFSVVATEIRKLAETSAVQTKTIGNVITDIVRGVNKMQEVTIESVSSFEQLGFSIKNMEKRFEQIMHGMDEQSIGAKEIIEVMRELKSYADNVKITATNMKKECVSFTNTIGLLNSQADDVLNNTDKSVSVLDGVQNLAEIATQQAEDNQSLSKKVSDMLSNYNV